MTFITKSSFLLLQINSDSLEKSKQLWYGYDVARWSHLMVLIKVNLADKKCAYCK